MRRYAVIRGISALLCALVFHAALVACAATFGWFSPDPTTLPELDLTSIDLSFSETPDETAAPATPPPQPAVEPPPAPEPPPPVPEPPPPAPEPPPPAPKPSPPPVAKASNPQPPSTPKNLPLPQVTPRPKEVKPEVKPVPKAPPKPSPAPKPQESPQPKPQPSVAVPPAPAPSQARVKVDKQPKLKTKIDTRRIYPEGARERGEEGSVTLMFEVTPGGRCANIRITESCGFPELEQAAIRAVTQARFEPARQGNARVPAPARITLTFHLRD